MELSTIISRCKRNDRKAQNQLFEHYAPLMMSICMRYLKNRFEAEDALVQGFYKVFDKIDTYQGNGSFEGWIKRIIVRECLMALRKNNILKMTVVVEDIENAISVPWTDSIGYEELLGLLDQLPDGYRTIFNLYVIEGYKHREIAEMLDISINTSKSQLILARKKLQSIFKKKSMFKIA